MSGPIAYRNTHIYVRGGNGLYMSEFSFNYSASCRSYGGSGTNYQAAVMKCKVAVNVAIANNKLSDYFLLGVER